MAEQGNVSEFCWIGHETCEHERCLRARDGNPTCDKGHPLIELGLCETCDVVEGFTYGEMLEALMKAGCAPKRVRRPPKPELLF